MHELIQDITFSIVTAWVLGVCAQFFRQPPILAYLAGGFLLGPSGLHLVRSEESIHIISELGLILMLFMIGLEIDLKKIIRAGTVIIGASVVQIAATCILALVFFWLILPAGGARWDPLYLAIAVALSSTVIIVKVLYEKRELDTLPGRITLGVLVLQDLFAILFLAIQPNLDDLKIGILALSIGRVIVLVGAAMLVSRFVLPWVFHRIARSPELVLVGALAWCFLVGEVGQRLHLSREMGALVAGVAISTFPYAIDVTAKVTTLRDFFITLFFVALGMTIPLPTASIVGLALLIVGFLLASRIVTVFFPLYLMRQGLRASLLPAINLSQMSEFSLVLIQVGVAAGQTSAQAASAASLAFVILAVLSTFAMTQSDSISRALIDPLKRLGFRDLDHTAHDEAEGGHAKPRRIVLLGFFRTASSLLSELHRKNPAMIEQVGVIDFNPQVYQTLTSKGVQVTYGDISNPDTLAHSGISHAEIVISTVPDYLLKGTSNEKLVRKVRAQNAKAKIIAVADLLEDVQQLYAAGADYVLSSRLVEAQELLAVINAAEKNLLADLRAALDARIDKREEVLP
ncbi:MAG TPA: cation:proton antiporter [Xanthobacteraceae bacterium]|nr:cation:proton antiporter [Xanthobacteraceae bacterium]